MTTLSSVPVLSHVRVLPSTRLVDAAEAYDRAVGAERYGCDGDDRCPCSGWCHHAGRTAGCETCEDAMRTLLLAASFELARAVVAAGLAPDVAEAARAAQE